MVADREDLERLAAGALDIVDESAEDRGQGLRIIGKRLRSRQELVLQRLERGRKVIGQ